MTKAARASGNNPSAEIVVRVRELAWAGQHEKAIELASQALDGTGLEAELHIDLLDLRAESYIARGRLDLAEKDAQAIEKLAQISQIQGLMAQAFNRLALVQMRIGDLDGALNSASAAVSANHTSPTLRAESYFRLAEAQFRIQKNDAAIENGQKAVDLYLAHGDLSGAGRAYWALANAYEQTRQIEKFQGAGSAAEDL